MNLKSIFFSFIFCFNPIAAENNETIHVWGTPLSPYVRKVLTVLEAKHLSYELHPTLPSILLSATHQSIPAEFEAISPLGKIPAIKVGQFALSDSAVIANFIEKKWPEEPLYPSEIENYGRALWYEKYADTIMTDVFQQLFIEKYIQPQVLKNSPDQEKVKRLLDRVPEILGYLEGELVKNNYSYLINNQLSISDIAIVHHFISLELCQIELDLKNYPALQTYLNKVIQHTAIKKTLNQI